MRTLCDLVPWSVILLHFEHQNNPRRRSRFSSIRLSRQNSAFCHLFIPVVWNTFGTVPRVVTQYGVPHCRPEVGAEICRLCLVSECRDRRCAQFQQCVTAYGDFASHELPLYDTAAGHVVIFGEEAEKQSADAGGNL